MVKYKGLKKPRHLGAASKNHVSQLAQVVASVLCYVVKCKMPHITVHKPIKASTPIKSNAISLSANAGST
jgi:hypothetical protein